MVQPYLVPGDYPVYFGTNGGLIVSQDGNSYSYYSAGLINTQVKGVAATSGQNVYLATEGGFSIWDGSSFTNKTTTDGLVSDYCYCVALAPDGKVWIGTNNGVSIWNGSSFTNYSTADGLSYNQVKSIAIDSNGIVYLGHEAMFGPPNLLSIYDGSTFTNKIPLGYGSVNGITIGYDGKLYLAIQGWGLVSYDTVTDTYITNVQNPNPDGSDNDATSVASGTNKIYYGDNNPTKSLMAYDGSTTSTYGSGFTQAGIYSNSIAVRSNGMVYMDSTYGGNNNNFFGYSVWNGSYFTNQIGNAPYPDAWHNNRVFSIAFTQPAQSVSPTNIKIVGNKIVGDITVDPTVSLVQYNNADITDGSVLRNTSTNVKYLKVPGTNKSYDVIPATPDPSWSWTTGTTAWTNLQNA